MVEKAMDSMDALKVVDDTEQKAFRINIRGLVQGVGFRPFVLRSANELRIKGWVKNTNVGVEILAVCTVQQMHSFLNVLQQNHPDIANIENITYQLLDVIPAVKDFEIKTSSGNHSGITVVSPDVAVCEDCLRDMKSQENRIDYPFINCTNCGPRFSIIQQMPYDRECTTMRSFNMCAECKMEFENTVDRRFHAQPVACKHCGPTYTLYVNGDVISDYNLVVKSLAGLINSGSIVTMKGMGGYNLACDALNEQAVMQLRWVKSRDSKPFAVMFRDLAILKQFAVVNKEEEQLLTGWQRPIVVLEAQKQLATGISKGFSTIGAMLPYLPIHFQLFELLDTPCIVLTSANVAGEPIVIDDIQAIKTFGKGTAAVLVSNREIFNRNDDSVSQVVNQQVQLLRRSRGYAPLPAKINRNVEGIFAAGAELTNCFCIGKEDYAIFSQHIGDLKNPETYAFYKESFQRFQALYKFKPTKVVYDLHPDYLSSTFARELGIPGFGVQHHHAHIVSVMAEHHLTGEVIGVCMDGTGYGMDGNIWGGEFLISTRSSFSRYSHLKYIPMPGGEKAVREPWRMAASYLYQVFGDKWTQLPIPFVESILQTKGMDGFVQLLPKSNLFPLTSSCGRLFDAVSALLGFCQMAGYHAEAPMRLEDAAKSSFSDANYSYLSGNQISMSPCMEEIVFDLIRSVPVSVIARKFHNTMERMIVEECVKASHETGIKQVVLAGGVFQNKLLLAGVMLALKRENLHAFTAYQFPVNDGGIALGQLMVAAELE